MMRRYPEQIDFLTTNVGRGHRFYLEGLREAVVELTPEQETQIFCAPEVCGALASPGWRLINLLYRRGSKADWFGRLYNRIRSKSGVNSDSAALRLFGAGLRRWWRSRNTPLVVDHPLLVRLLSSVPDRAPLIYMHGEMVAPDESLTAKADLIITPTEGVKRRFVDAGVVDEKIVVTGLCVERSLVPLADISREARLRRIKVTEQLTGAFFSSGAEPLGHCSLIVHAARSCLARSQRVIVFAVGGGRLERMLKNSGLLAESGMKLQTFSSIAEEESKLASVFAEIDCFLAPAHERTNWALGLGLPFFVLLPCYGSFAPLNWDIALKYARAKTLATIKVANDFGLTLEELQLSGELNRMNLRESSAPQGSQVGIDGFKRSAEELVRILNRMQQK